MRSSQRGGAQISSFPTLPNNRRTHRGDFHPCSVSRFPLGSPHLHQDLQALVKKSLAPSQRLPLCLSGEMFVRIGQSRPTALLYCRTLLCFKAGGVRLPPPPPGLRPRADIQGKGLKSRHKMPAFYKAEVHKGHKGHKFHKGLKFVSSFVNQGSGWRLCSTSALIVCVRT